MSSKNSRTITAFFDTRSEADAAIAELRDAGIDDANMSVRAGTDGSASAASTQTEHKGFFESLADIFMPDDDREVHAEGLRRGGYLVAVTPEGGSDDFIYDILESRGSVDLDDRANTWRSEGWQSGHSLETSSAGLLNDESEGLTKPADDASFLGSVTASSGQVATNDDVIAVVEEQLTVGKRDVSHGRVRIRSYFTETPVSEQVSLHQERVSIERRPVDRPVSDADAAFRVVTIEAQETAEEAVIAKEVRVVEEIALRKESQERVETITDTIRKQEVEIDDERVDRTITKSNR